MKTKEWRQSQRDKKKKVEDIDRGRHKDVLTFNFLASPRLDLFDRGCAFIKCVMFIAFICGIFIGNSVSKLMIYRSEKQRKFSTVE